MTDQTEAPTGTDRRSLLRKAAITAGMVTWTTPVVQAVTARPAFAQTVSNCTVNVTVNLQETGSTCQCVPGGAPTSCCNNNTFVFLGATLDCGPTCGGPRPINTIDAAETTVCSDAQVAIYSVPGGGGSFRVSGTATCGDHSRTFRGDPVPTNVRPCLLAAAPSVVEEQIVPAEPGAEGQPGADGQPGTDAGGDSQTDVQADTDVQVDTDVQTGADGQPGTAGTGTGASDTAQSSSGDVTDVSESTVVTGADGTGSDDTSTSTP